MKKYVNLGLLAVLALLINNTPLELKANIKYYDI